tara:strand:- start:2440 stop:2781 length:342 start_codon:yes stop_codon:yes gene_type:complete
MSRFENRKWLVIPTTLINDIDFNEIREPNAESLRLSLDGQKTFVKYDVKVVQETYTETFTDEITGDEISSTTEAGVYGRPSIYSEDYEEYGHSEMLELLSTEEWYINEPEEQE